MRRDVAQAAQNAKCKMKKKNEWKKKMYGRINRSQGKVMNLIKLSPWAEMSKLAVGKKKWQGAWLKCRR